MNNKDVIRMLEDIENRTFCKNGYMDFEYCPDEGCLQCQINFCKQELENGLADFLKMEMGNNE